MRIVVDMTHVTLRGSNVSEGQAMFAAKKAIREFLLEADVTVMVGGIESRIGFENVKTHLETYRYPTDDDTPLTVEQILQKD